MSLIDPSRRPLLETLPRGLHIRLLSLQPSTRAAALVRVHAGSHDAPAEYPGLAHFLEHLLFLGSRDFPVQDSLMAFVQGCGGQLNASTRERHTDFFFQVPADQFEEALLRLLDMLANPLLDVADQLREREVLHAEFMARGQDAGTLCDAALGLAFDTSHPFSGFHAGNRETLPVEEEQFQQALRSYHRRFYRCGQIEWLLAGPQGETELRRLATRADACLPEAADAPTRMAPALHCRRDAWLRLQLDQVQPQLHLAFTYEELSDDCVPALDYLGTWIESEAPGGLLQRLRHQGLCESLRLRVPYGYAGQGLVVIEASLTHGGLADRGEVVSAILDWLRFFADASLWQSCRPEYLRIRRRSLQVAGPLARLRHWIEPQAWAEDSDEIRIAQTFHMLLEQMLGAGPLVLTADSKACAPVEGSGFPLRMAFERPMPSRPKNRDWQRPSPNPWLQSASAKAGSVSGSLAIDWQGPEHPAGQGAVFLCWQFDQGRPAARLWHAVSHALTSYVWAAQQAGVALRFEDLGDRWSLGLSGYADAIPAILTDVASLLAELPPASLEAGAVLAERARTLGNENMLIRQLLMRLPAVLAGPGAAAVQWTLVAHLQASHWQGLAVGLPSGLQATLSQALLSLPGIPGMAALGSSAPASNYCWHTVDGAAEAETALLLFCPLPTRDARCEAAWRVLAVLMEAVFFRRLRSELQLGYVVFSRFYQAGSHPGLLFGVQSPTATGQEIQAHIRAFLEDFAGTLAGQDDEMLSRTVEDMSRRHVIEQADFQAHAEQAWHTQLAGHGRDRPSRVAEAMRALTCHDLAVALDSLRNCSGGWVVLSNAAAPDLRRS